MITWDRTRRITATSRPTASSRSAWWKQSGCSFGSVSAIPESRYPSITTSSKPITAADAASSDVAHRCDEGLLLLRRQPVERLALLAQRRVVQVALLAAGGAHEHGADALGVVLRERRRTLGRLVVGMGVDGEHRQWGVHVGHREQVSERSPDRCRTLRCDVRPPLRTAARRAAGRAAHRSSSRSSRWPPCSALAACDTGDGKTLSEPADHVHDDGATAGDAGVGAARGGPGRAGGAGGTPVAADRRLEHGPPDVPGLRSLAGRRGRSTPIYTCDGENISPTVSWLSPPAGHRRGRDRAGRRHRARR